jgi:hypothetical protein
MNMMGNFARFVAPAGRPDSTADRRGLKSAHLSNI